MEPIDYSKANWKDIEGHLHGKRLEVLSAWREYGPGTTREVAERAGIDILTFRPRTTELFQLGLIELTDKGETESAKGHEGTYRAIPLWQALHRFNDRVAAAKDAQLSLL